MPACVHVMAVRLAAGLKVANFGKDNCPSENDGDITFHNRNGSTAVSPAQCNISNITIFQMAESTIFFLFQAQDMENNSFRRQCRNVLGLMCFDTGIITMCIVQVIICLHFCRMWLYASVVLAMESLP